MVSPSSMTLLTIPRRSAKHCVRCVPRIRVRAFGNALELKQMTGSAQWQINKSDCKDCIGKKFVDKGQGQPGPDIIYGGDLPPDYRPIGPTHGVKGMVHNPNRINLILDSDNKIVMAFWE